MSDKLKPALIGGVVLGLLSVIPIISLGNVCCCLWAILGGLLASQMYIKSSGRQVTVGEGAVLGVFAGLVGGAIYVVFAIPIQLTIGPKIAGTIVGLFQQYLPPQQAEIIRARMQAGQSIVAVIFSSLINAIVLLIFSTLGGLLAVPIFEKRKATPPPPPSYGT